LSRVTAAAGEAARARPLERRFQINTRCARSVLSVIRLARQLVRGQAEADDVVAETFAKILDLLRRGGGPEGAFRPYLLWTFALFILGASVVYFVVMPLAMKFFLSMEQTGGQVEIHLQARVSEYLSLIMTLIIGFGIMFQLPVVLTLLAQAGIVNAQNLRDFRRYAIVAITAAAGILSPPDPFSMVAMALPTILLYEAAIYAVVRVEKIR